MNNVLKGIGAVTAGVVLAVLANGCCASATNVETNFAYRDGTNVYKGQTSGMSQEDASKINDELYKIWATAADKDKAVGAVDAHIAKIRAYKTALEEKEKFVDGLLDCEAKTNLLGQIDAVKEDIDAYLDGFEGWTDVSATVELDGRFVAKANGTSGRDAGMALREQAQKYFKAAGQGDKYTIDLEDTYESEVQAIVKQADAMLATEKEKKEAVQAPKQPAGK